MGKNQEHRRRSWGMWRVYVPTAIQELVAVNEEETSWKEVQMSLPRVPSLVPARSLMNTRRLSRR